VQAEFERAGGYAWRSRLEGIARGLGFSPEDLERPLETFSGGELTRASLTRALAGEPDLLLLDEPNAGVDHDSQEAIAQTLATRAAAGASVLVVLHELGPFAPLIDRVIALRDGRVTYDGPPDQLVDGGAHVHHHDQLEVGLVPPMKAPLERGH
jgi:zinc transport system ATP-binding protein